MSRDRNRLENRFTNTIFFRSHVVVAVHLVHVVRAGLKQQHGVEVAVVADLAYVARVERKNEEKEISNAENSERPCLFCFRQKQQHNQLISTSWRARPLLAWRRREVEKTFFGKKRFSVHAVSKQHGLFSSAGISFHLQLRHDMFLSCNK
jgi:hypothetical protein